MVREQLGQLFYIGSYLVGALSRFHQFPNRLNLDFDLDLGSVLVTGLGMEWLDTGAAQACCFCLGRIINISPAPRKIRLVPVAASSSGLVRFGTYCGTA